MATKKKSAVEALPTSGLVFWPVGTGDSTTVVVEKGVVLEIDLHQLECAAGDGDPHVSIIDELVRLLPKVNGKPYLSVFALTHPDEDHCCGFKRLMKEVTIGELWFSPRIFREYKKDLCDDACGFQDEAKRRVKKTIEKGSSVGAGDRVRIIGYDELLEEDEFKGFPKERLTIPGNAITELDGADKSAAFRAFVHGPFKDDCDGERNDTSLGFQIRLIQGEVVGHALLLGDHCYPTVNKIFTISEKEDVHWNVFLAPHHCSKSVMYWKDAGDEEETLKQEVLEKIEENGGSPGVAYIVASCEPVPASNKPGDCPPHAIAKARYEEIAPDGFMCTQETPTASAPEPIVFAMTDEGLALASCEPKAVTNGAKMSPLAAAVTGARGADRAPVDRVGFGRP